MDAAQCNAVHTSAEQKSLQIRDGIEWAMNNDQYVGGKGLSLSTNLLIPGVKRLKEMVENNTISKVTPISPETRKGSTSQL